MCDFDKEKKRKEKNPTLSFSLNGKAQKHATKIQNTPASTLNTSVGITTAVGLGAARSSTT